MSIAHKEDHSLRPIARLLRAGCVIGAPIAQGRWFRRLLGALPAVAGLSALSALAQIGMSESHLAQLWGQPVSGNGDTNSLRSLRFATNGMSIEAHCMDGVVRRMQYRMPGFAEAQVPRLLNLNSEDQAWERWPSCERTALPGTIAVWSRSDEKAMAALAKDVLTISSRQWDEAVIAATEVPTNSVPEVIRPVAQVAAPQPDKRTPPTAFVPPAPPSGTAGDKATAHQAAPAVRPEAPAVLPVKGDSKESAVRLLGAPDGIMLSQGREVLVYTWGSVWVANGVVTGVE